MSRRMINIDWANIPHRIIAMVQWLIENSQRVAAMGRGKVTFSFSGSALSVELNEVIQVE
ncbi:MAG: hypothetical protein JXR84_04260 [Anaerolineae bacterium]|nr:hypothetical protein [Anaerolineae bacterium]